ncbi:MAG: adenylate kinase [Bacillota bacterium]
MHLLFLGAPGSGKGTQAKLLAEKHGLSHIAPGDIFRREIRNKTELGLLVEGILARGDLVDDATTLRIIEKAMSEAEATGFVLDGFPRNLAQAEALDKMLAASGRKLDLVLNLVVPEEKILERARTRRVCSACGRPYSLAVQPPRISGVCDDCGGELVIRKDDREETVRDRLSVYHRLTQPLEDYYGQEGLVVAVDGEGDVQDVAMRIEGELAARNLVK